MIKSQVNTLHMLMKKVDQYLAYGGFKWLNQKEIYKSDVNSIGENSSIGYELEVDFEYPDELHELRNDYPLAPENLKLIMICCQIVVVILQIIIR